MVRKQATELPDGKGRQACQYVLQIRPRLDAQALASGREAEEYRSCLPATRGTYRQPVFASYSYPFHLSFSHIVVNGQEARVGITPHASQLFSA